VPSKKRICPILVESQPAVSGFVIPRVTGIQPSARAGAN
jgi:hypothetical protein